VPWTKFENLTIFKTCPIVYSMQNYGIFDAVFRMDDFYLCFHFACQRFILPTLNPVILFSICNLKQRVWIECHGFCSSVEMSWVDIGLAFF